VSDLRPSAFKILCALHNQARTQGIQIYVTGGRPDAVTRALRQLGLVHQLTDGQVSPYSSASSPAPLRRPSIPPHRGALVKQTTNTTGGTARRRRLAVLVAAAGLAAVGCANDTAPAPSHPETSSTPRPVHSQRLWAGPVRHAKPCSPPSTNSARHPGPIRAIWLRPGRPTLTT